MPPIARRTLQANPARDKLFQPFGPLALSALALLIATTAHAQTASWTGAVSDDWSTAENWSGGSVPAAGTVTINTIAPNPAVGSGVEFTGTTLNVGSTSGSSGQLHLTDGSNLGLSSVNIGTSGTGHVTVTDSRLSMTGSLSVGSSALGHLVVSGATAEVVVGDNSHLNIGNQNGGFGRVDILNGASVTAGNVTLGNLRGAGVLNIDGAGSILNITRSDLSVAGLTGDTDIFVTNGGRIDIRGQSPTTGMLQLHGQPETTIRLRLDGEGSQISSTGHALLGQTGTVRASVTDGAVLSTDALLVVGVNSGTDTELLVATGAEARAGTEIHIGRDGGQGRVTLVEGGRLVSAGNVYLGSHNVQSVGTLNIGAAAGAAAAAAGIIEAPEIGFGPGAATLVFNHTDTAHAFSTGLVSTPDGTHLIDHIAGTTIFTGDGAGFTGTTEIRGGRLVVSGPGNLGGKTNVRAMGTLGGTGTLASVTVGDGAIISPGDTEGDIATLSVAGDIAFESGAVYRVEVDPQDGSRSDLIHATGTATLNGGSVLHLGLLGDYRPSDTWTILTADEGVNGRFDGVSSSFAYLDPTLSYDAQNVYLNLTRNDVAFCIAGMSANQCATGEAVESAGGGNLLFDAVIALDEAGAARAFDLLSGEVHGSIRSALTDESRFVREAVSARMRLAAAAPADGAAGTQAGWGRFYGARGRIDGNGNAGRIDRSTAGLLTGADAAVGETGRLGILAGYSHSSFHLDDRASSAATDNIHLGLYGGAEWNALRLSGGLAHSWHDITTDRTVEFSDLGEDLAADYGARTLQIFGEAARPFDTTNGTAEAFAALAHVRLTSKAFSERGGAAALSSGGETLDTTFATLGLRTASQLSLSSLPATVVGTLGWRHAFGNVEPTATHEFAGGTPFTVTGIPIERNVVIIEAGLNLDLSASAAFGVSYHGQIGSRTRDHGLNATFSVRF